ncbi:hypothetical protein [Heyndrickxia acidicola]|uniref:Uncharacterized protein n=1 Tax=Heyndrickxia acidicola TaxID=209389 RepID=A0ABU6MAS7_9BACI|nr:hypothetical protein [Heyndrickxia acidicola]MED1201777.1 hypothetical protein [Heyndrickxia acidicola]
MGDLNFSIDNNILKHSKVLTSITTPFNPNIAFLVMGEEVKPQSKANIVRIYHTRRNAKNNKFQITAELEAFQFSSYQSAKAFVKKLPEMTGLEMLMLMNKIPLQGPTLVQ